MRRLARLSVAVFVCGLVMVCAALVYGNWAQMGQSLVMPGADHVEFERRGLAASVIRYDLPAQTKRSQVGVYFEQQGWRRISLSELNRTQPTFVRVTRIAGPILVRDVLVAQLFSSRQQAIELQLARCVQIARWTTCF